MFKGSANNVRRGLSGGQTFAALLVPGCQAPCQRIFTLHTIHTTHTMSARMLFMCIPLEDIHLHIYIYINMYACLYM